MKDAYPSMCLQSSQPKRTAHVLRTLVLVLHISQSNMPDGWLHVKVGDGWAQSVLD